MPNQTVFQRYELKFMLTQAQKESVQKQMAPYMELDQYGRTTIRNIYFDTKNYQLIRRSIERPVYKEKLRIRSYRQASEDSEVFVELKKKFDHVVYKRRIPMTEKSAMEWVWTRKKLGEQYTKGKKDLEQIAEEIEYFVSFYESLNPVVFLSYEREAFYAKDGSDFRVTFDENILCRQAALSLEEDVWGTKILEDDKVLMEIKCSGGIPLWMTQILSEEQIYKTSFSKYGTAYQTIIYPKIQEEIRNGRII